MVYRIFAEKKKAFANEAAALRYDVRHLLSIKSLQDVRLLKVSIISRIVHMELYILFRSGMNLLQIRTKV